MLPLFAGMTRVSAVLTEAAKARLEVISFFLLVLVLSAVAVRWLWNGMARDVPRLPRLSLGRAVGVVVLWGACAVVVLAMISGARELMTPGAWKPDGVTYKLAAPDPPPPSGPTEDERRKKLDDLRLALWAFAATHGGNLPPTPDDPAVLRDKWATPHASGMRYLYIPGRKIEAAGRDVVAVEPQLFGEGRFALSSDGQVRLMTSDELREGLQQPEAKP